MFGQSVVMPPPSWSRCSRRRQCNSKASIRRQVPQRKRLDLLLARPASIERSPAVRCLDGLGMQNRLSGRMINFEPFG